VGLVGAMIDTRFRTLATPYLVSWIYRGCMAVVVLVTACWMLLALWVAGWRNGWLWGLMGLIVAPVVGAVLLLIVRVCCEFVLLRFRAVAPPLPPVSPPAPGPRQRRPAAPVDQRPDGRQGDDGSADGS
jgi:hypothetical protein